MRLVHLPLLCGLLPSFALAGWAFNEPRVVAEIKASDQWLQLQSSGRKNIAVASGRIGLVYERYDREKGEIYLATARAEQAPQSFSLTIVDETGKPHDPVIRVTDGRFVVAWLDDEGAWLRFERGTSLSDPISIHAGEVGEVTLAADSDHIYAFWSQRVGANWQLMTRTLTWSNGEPALSESVAVAPLEAQKRQRRPAAAVVDGRVVAAWQDRTTGTSIIYAAVSKDGTNFGEPAAVNETIVKSADWGKGSSAIDGTFGVSADSKLVLAWLDKRSSRSGYKVYASVNRSLDKDDWKINQKVQDEFGDFTPQWNIALSDSATDSMVAAWSDSREDNPDIWLADYQGGLWAEDEAAEPAATENSETDPSVTIDDKGVLHMVWLVADPSGGKRILYVSASR